MQNVSKTGIPPPELIAAHGFIEVLPNFKVPTVNVCCYCDTSHATTELAYRLGFKVSHGACVPCYQQKLKEQGLD